MVFVGFWSGFGEVFGSRNTFKMLPKMVPKNCLNLDTILDEVGNNFGVLFRLRMGGPGQNFRVRSGSMLRWRFGGAHVPSSARFFVDLVAL